jgi:hypothetical protein
VSWLFVGFGYFDGAMGIGAGMCREKDEVGGLNAGMRGRVIAAAAGVNCGELTRKLESTPDTMETSQAKTAGDAPLYVVGRTSITEIRDERLIVEGRAIAGKDEVDSRSLDGV